ncbi:hypothetical protein EGW08_005884 [Elysia chlorotica]|uniref:C2H2-type domain-containing protein n=1 Tax=Elysia chlorotica TaxID=188477 RepID=A0A3S1BLD8_ELYCH|nr:hypothetical protein EGW08_005884 [Elysia chlorotica]
MNSDKEESNHHNGSLDLFDEDDDDFIYTSMSNQDNQAHSTVDSETAESLCTDLSAPQRDLLEGNREKSAEKEKISNAYLDTGLTCSTVADQSLSLSSEALHCNDVSTENYPRKRHKREDQYQFNSSTTDEFSKDESFPQSEHVNKSSTSRSENSAVKQPSHSDTHKSLRSSFMDNFVQSSSTDPPKYYENRQGAAEREQLSFSCPFCCVSESCVLLLEQHIFTAHPDSSDKPVSSLDGEEAFSTGFLSVCPLCDMDLETDSALAVHLASVHSEEEDAKSSGSTGCLSCPLCDVTCASDQEMASHVKTHESDSTYYGISASGTFSEPEFVPFTESQVLVCPMCGKAMDDPDLLTSHVEIHFSPQHRPGVNNDLDAVNKENIPLQQKKTFPTGKSKQKTDRSVANSAQGQARSPPLSTKDVTSYRRQYELSLERDVLRGRISVVDYHEQRAGMQGNDLKGVDDGHSRVDGVIEQLGRLYRQQARPGQQVYLCSPTSHFSGSHGDKGWGCGYRNFQMMLSCLAHQSQYADKIFKNGRPLIPSVPKVQQMIESAWGKGFDPDGCRQLRGCLVNTQKWIGATEIVATLASLGVRCRLADFHAPSAPDGTHPRLLEWVTDYFTSRQPQQFTPPLYLQHQGHSRTIVGVEVDRGTTRLLLFDPGSKRDHIAGLLSNGLDWKSMRTFRRTQAAFKARQYQIVAVVGILTAREYEESKIIKSERIS